MQDSTVWNFETNGRRNVDGEVFPVSARKIVLLGVVSGDNKLLIDGIC
ncbi:unnamed protein product [Haemonchus placei]|uniref:Uncharacterized protein n=1 Tax=Haemonchus placei TaxID=6290 RepID=A0A3P7YI07_HAEPC|nr:unnamed protein product [Haemonchus placei]